MSATPAQVEYDVRCNPLPRVPPARRGGVVNPTDDVCTCSHLAADHPDDNEPSCQVCDCEWFYAGREDW